MCDNLLLKDYYSFYNSEKYVDAYCVASKIVLDNPTNQNAYVLCADSYINANKTSFLTDKEAQEAFMEHIDWALRASSSPGNYIDCANKLYDFLDNWKNFVLDTFFDSIQNTISFETWNNIHSLFNLFDNLDESFQSKVTLTRYDIFSFNPIDIDFSLFYQKQNSLKNGILCKLIQVTEDTVLSMRNIAENVTSESLSYIVNQVVKPIINKYFVILEIFDYCLNSLPNNKVDFKLKCLFLKAEFIDYWLNLYLFPDGKATSFWIAENRKEQIQLLKTTYELIESYKPDFIHPPLPDENPIMGILYNT